MVSWITDRVDGSIVDWLGNCVIHWAVDSMFDCLCGRLRLANCVIDLEIEWTVDLVTDWLLDYDVECVIAWVVDCMVHSMLDWIVDWVLAWLWAWTASARTSVIMYVDASANVRVIVNAVVNMRPSGQTMAWYEEWVPRITFVIQTKTEDNSG